MKKFCLLIITVVSAEFIYSQACSDLFISEYVEGSSSNKALEIFNPTSSSVNLSSYTICRFTNGATTATVFGMSGTLAPGATYVIVNSQADSLIRLLADTIAGFPNFNGNDALALLHLTDTLDVIGVIGVNPGTNWPVGTGSTLDHTLVRKETVQTGTTNWALSSTQWYSFPVDNVSDLGSHTMNACGGPVDTLIMFSPVSATLSESSGTFDVLLVLNQLSPSTTFSVDVELTGGTGDAADINNYTTQTITISAGAVSNALTLVITDDVLQEPLETLVFRLANPSAGLTIGADSIFTLSIVASDVPVPIVPISQITPLNSSYQPDSLGKVVVTRGTVYGVNNRATGLQFTIHDATDGIQVFAPVSNFGYTVNETDSVAVRGAVAFFNGMTQLSTLDTIYKIGAGVLATPLLAQDLDESTESELVRINNVHLVAPSQWDTTGNASGFSCDITDGVNTWTLRIDEQTNIFKTNMPKPQFTFDVIGIGGQFDNTAPYNSGYQILPRYMQDFILHSGIQETGETNVRIYPNPTRGQFIIERNSTEPAELRIFDITGNLVLSSELSDSKFVTVNSSELKAGVYFIEIATGKSRTFSKVCVCR